MRSHSGKGHEVQHLRQVRVNCARAEIFLIHARNDLETGDLRYALVQMNAAREVLEVAAVCATAGHPRRPAPRKRSRLPQTSEPARSI